MTAVFPTRLPVPITASVGTSTASIRGGAKRKSGPSYGTPSASARLTSASRSRGPRTGSSDRSSTRSGWCVRHRGLERRLEGDAVPVDVCAQLLRPADEDRGDNEVLDLFEGGAHDGRVVLPVDDRDSTSRRAHPRVVTSCSILLVYFSYSNVSVENWMMRSSPWNGCLREMETWCPLTSITL